MLVVESDVVVDGRGAFIRTFDATAFADAGVEIRYRDLQASVSTNPFPRTLRGLHYQLLPAVERKIIRCSRGRIFDVAVDLRPQSSTHRSWFGIELAAGGADALFIPEGFAHGFVTLEDDSHVSYIIDAPYRPELARGVRWNDPAFAIEWPVTPEILSPRDASWPLYEA